jgi:hypothetical protein
MIGSHTKGTRVSKTKIFNPKAPGSSSQVACAVKYSRLSSIDAGNGVHGKILVIIVT